MKKLERSLFLQSADIVAPLILGWELVHESSKGLVSGRIIETEAYLGSDDPACHASRGMTPRNTPMFEPGGISYVYFIYGMYHCFNIVTGPKGSGEAVLIRALEPIQGVELMRKRRGREDMKELCSGPGKLCMAMGISPDHNDHPLWKRPLFLKPSPSLPSEQVGVSSRIGISAGADLELRFFEKGHPGISKRQASRKH